MYYVEFFAQIGFLTVLSLGIFGLYMLIFWANDRVGFSDLKRIIERIEKLEERKK